MTTQLVGRICDGGHYNCSPPKECCKQGCCYLFINSSTITRPSASLTTSSLFNPLFLGHWYFWLAVTATVAGILCACSLWKRHSQNSLCCRSGGRAESRVSEPDSNGSYYAPPQYSRCNSFHQAPPPYSEVTSKPDLYPIVINYQGDPVIKTNNPSTGYLMVQYFRNFIVRPVGTLSTTSTIDSISSSFICNVANEANTIIPPPYSSANSLDEVRTGDGGTDFMPTSASALNVVVASPKMVVSIRENPCFGQIGSQSEALSDIATGNELPKSRVNTSQCSNCDASSPRHKIHSLHQSQFQTSQESSDHPTTFSDLLNLSAPSIPPVNSVSMTGSDTNNSGNFAFSSSPPRATSPTVEMRHLLARIQQLPQSRQQNDPQSNRSRAKAKTLYMPLLGDEEAGAVCGRKGTKVLGWLSRSAPNTPCSNFVPNFPTQRNNRPEASPLLRESEEDANDTL